VELAVPLALAALCGLLSGWIAQRKNRSFGWWFVAGFVAPVPGLLISIFATPGGEPWRFRAPLVLLVLAVGLAGSLVLFALAAELFA